MAETERRTPADLVTQWQQEADDRKAIIGWYDSACSVLDKCADELEAALRQAELQKDLSNPSPKTSAESGKDLSGWQLIDTAGDVQARREAVLVWPVWTSDFGPIVSRARWSPADGEWLLDDDCTPVEPAHWMPLPAPPTPEAQVEQERAE